MLTITVGGITYTSDVADTGGFDWTKLTIQDIMAPTGDLASISGTFQYPRDLPSKYPETETEMVISFSNGDVSDDDYIAEHTLFGGVVETVDVKLIGRNVTDISVDARDYTKWMDQKLVSGVFTESNGGAMVNSILSTFTTGFSNAGVTYTGDILPKVFNFVPVSEAIQEIADTCQCSWYVNADRVVHFLSFADADNAAPMSLYNVDTEMDVGNLQLTRTTENIQNGLIIKDFFLRSTNIFYEPGNHAFPVDDTGIDIDTQAAGKRVVLTYLPYDLDEFTFEVNETPGADTWVSKTPQWDSTANTIGVDDLNDNFVYVNPGHRSSNAFVRWGFDVAAGSDVRVSYRPLITGPFPEIAREPHSITEFARRESAGGRTSDGIYERLISFNDLEFTGTDPIQALIDFGSVLLSFHAWPHLEGTFETTSDKYHGWRAGQTFQMVSNAFDIYDLGQYVRSGRTVKQPVTLWVKAVRIKPLAHDLLHYKITFTNRYRSI